MQSPTQVQWRVIFVTAVPTLLLWLAGEDRTALAVAAAGGLVFWKLVPNRLDNAGSAIGETLVRGLLTEIRDSVAEIQRAATGAGQELESLNETTSRIEADNTSDLAADVAQVRRQMTDLHEILEDIRGVLIDIQTASRAARQEPGHSA